MVEAPAFIKNHPILKHYEVKKVFPCMGLENNFITIDIDPNSVCEVDAQVIFFDALLKAANYHKNINDTKKRNLHDMVPLQGAYVEFSSAMQDILTMSMRGLTSCVRWDGERRQTLVGSIIDPYCSIIFIRSSIDKGNEYGTPMWYRSVVRLIEVFPGDVASNKPKEYALFLEKTYCGTDKEQWVPYVRWLFKSYLKEHTSLPVHDVASPGMKIPLSEPVKELMDYDYQNLYSDNKGFVCYRDSNIGYASDINCDWKKLEGYKK